MMSSSPLPASSHLKCSTA
ncbi:unnamed protein product, partial [Vitis vinifera]